MGRRSDNGAPGAIEAGEGQTERQTPPMIAPAEHPKMRELIRRAKGWGGLAGFVVTALASWAGGTVPAQACLRALLGGVVGYLVGWSIALGVSRSLMKAEARIAIDGVLEHRRKQREALTATAVARAEAGGGEP